MRFSKFTIFLIEILRKKSFQNCEENAVQCVEFKLMKMETPRNAVVVDNLYAILMNESNRKIENLGEFEAKNNKSESENANSGSFILEQVEMH